MREAAPVQELNAGVHQGLPEIRGLGISCDKAAGQATPSPST